LLTSRFPVYYSERLTARPHSMPNRKEGKGTMNQYTASRVDQRVVFYTAAVGFGSGSGCGRGSSSPSGSGRSGSGRHGGAVTIRSLTVTVRREPEGIHGTADSTRTRS